MSNIHTRKLLLQHPVIYPELILLCDRLRRYNLSQPLQSWRLEPCKSRS